MSKPSETLTLYRAMWENEWALEGAPSVLVVAGTFTRKPKSWRRHRDGDGADRAWDYLTHFNGCEKPPGFATPGEAVQSLIDRTRRTIEHKEKTLASEKKRLAVAEDFLSRIEEEATNDE